MRSFKVAHCRACQAPIIWIPTPGGSHMPCDQAPVTARLAPGITLVSESGVVQRGSVKTTDVETTGYVPHWATCPEGASFRRLRRAVQ